MPRTVRSILLLLAAVAPPAARGAAGEAWPQFRGPDGQGHASATGLPITWSESENVAWKSPVPGHGWSSPVIGAGGVWITAADDDGRSLRAVCFDQATGRMVHNVEVFRPSAPPPINGKNTYASPTPVLDAGRLWVHFGALGTACLATKTGEVLWRNNELQLDHKEGPGSSPILCGNLLVVHCDGIDVQYIAALDRATGKVTWKTERSGAKHANPDFRKAYSTPLVIELGDRRQIVSVGADRAYAYEPATGAAAWHVDFEGFSNVPRPLFGHGLVFFTTGYTQPELWAVRPPADGQGPAEVVWRTKSQVPANPSPILVGEELFMVSDQGVLSCLDARTGREHFRARLGGNYSASPVTAEGRIYFCGEAGETVVVEAGPKFHLVARNPLDGRLLASPAVAEGAIFLRTDTHVYRIEQSKRAAAAAGQAEAR